MSENEMQWSGRFLSLNCNLYVKLLNTIIHLCSFVWTQVDLVQTWNDSLVECMCVFVKIRQNNLKLCEVYLVCICKTLIEIVICFRNKRTEGARICTSGKYLVDHLYSVYDDLKHFYLKKHIQLLSALNMPAQEYFLCVKCASDLLLTRILVPNRKHPEYEGTECGGKISPPVIPHRKIGRCDFNTEQHPWWWWKVREEEGQRERKDYSGEGKMRMDSTRNEIREEGKCERKRKAGERGRQTRREREETDMS